MKLRAHMLNRAMVIVVVGASTAMAQPQWTAMWNGVGRPGPENLVFTTGWPTDPAGFEQYDRGNCYDAPGPNYAELINVDTAGFLSMQNVVDASCMGIGPTLDAAPCDFNDPNPCGMRYQAGPWTPHVEGQPNNRELLHYQQQFGWNLAEPMGMTFEISFNIQQLPSTGPVKLMDIKAYITNDPVDRGGAATCEVTLRKNLVGILDGVSNPNEWHVVLQDGTPGRTWDFGEASSMVGQWVTARVTIGEWCGKFSKFGWRDGFLLARTATGTDTQKTGSGEGFNSYVRFGPDNGDGDIRIGAMAYSNQGMFSPNPLGTCLEHHCGFKYLLPYLEPARLTPANPEICNNNIDDDGDGKTDCNDPDCFQDNACGNVLFNGGFDVGSTTFGLCGNATPQGVPASKPFAWQEQGTSGQLVVNGTIWPPFNPPSVTEGMFRGSLSTGSAPLSAAWQQRQIPIGPVRLRGDLGGAGAGTTIFVEMRDGNINGNVIQRFQFAGSEFNPDFRAFDLTGNNTSGFVTVRWGLEGGSGARGAHIDNVYLAPVVAASPELVSAKSRRQHGAAGTFDIMLPLVGAAVEPRQVGANAQVILTFDEAPPATDGSFNCGQEVVVTNATCSSVSAAGNNLTVNLSSAQKNACVTLGVSGIVGLTGDTNVSFITHEGNADGNTSVNILDLQAIKNQLNQPLTNANFTTDVNVSGTVNILDLQASKNNLLQPAACP